MTYRGREGLGSTIGGWTSGLLWFQGMHRRCFGFGSFGKSEGKSCESCRACRVYANHASRVRIQVCGSYQLPLIYPLSSRNLSPLHQKGSY